MALADRLTPPMLPPNAKSEPTARLFAQVGSTDGLCGNGNYNERTDK